MIQSAAPVGFALHTIPSRQCSLIQVRSLFPYRHVTFSCSINEYKYIISINIPNRLTTTILSVVALLLYETEIICSDSISTLSHNELQCQSMMKR